MVVGRTDCCYHRSNCIAAERILKQFSELIKEKLQIDIPPSLTDWYRPVADMLYRLNTRGHAPICVDELVLLCSEAGKLQLLDAC